MKRVIISTIMFLSFTVFASAQTASRNSSTTTRAVSTTTKAKKAKKNLKPSDTLNNRKAYLFKNGQRSTPTGAEAVPSTVGGQYAAIGGPRKPAVKKDTSAARKPSTPANKEQ